MTRGLCPVGGWWGGVGGMYGARRRSPRSGTRLASVRCLAAFACRHVWRVIGWRRGVLVAQLARHHAIYLRSAWSPRFSSAISTGASSRCGGPSVSSMASTVGSSRCGWARGAGGAAASSFIVVAARVWPFGKGAGLGSLPIWPASARVLLLPSAAAGRVAGVPPSGCGTPVGSPWPGVFARGASVAWVACAGSGSGSGLGAGGLPDGASVGSTTGLAGGLWR